MIEMVEFKVIYLTNPIKPIPLTFNPLLTNPHAITNILPHQFHQNDIAPYDA